MVPHRCCLHWDTTLTALPVILFNIYFPSLLLFGSRLALWGGETSGWGVWDDGYQVRAKVVDSMEVRLSYIYRPRILHCVDIGCHQTSSRWKRSRLPCLGSHDWLDHFSWPMPDRNGHWSMDQARAAVFVPQTWCRDDSEGPTYHIRHGKLEACFSSLTSLCSLIPQVIYTFPFVYQRNESAAWKKKLLWKWKGKKQ